jgi:hypothetical protein
LTTTPARASTVADQPGPGYTLHIDFTAPSFAHAQLIAIDLAQGLGHLRADIDTCSARVSSPTTPEQPQPVFCGARGPDGERCADEPEHGGYHAEGGVDGRAWSDHEPRMVRFR